MARLDPPLKPAPKPDWIGPPPHEEEFATWCDDPVTRFVATSYLRMAEEQKRAWDAASWQGGEANEKLLVELRTRADAYSAFFQTTWDQHVRSANSANYRPR